MKILSAIIAHPLRKVSGATNAGYQLSRETAELVDMDLAIMWDKDEVLHDGPLTVRRLRSTTSLDWAGDRVPRFVRIPLYQTSMPGLVRSGAYDLVHMHNMVPTFAAERLATACIESKVPYVISTHGFYEVQRYAKINGFGPIKSALVDISITRPFKRTVAGATAIFALSDCEVPSLIELGVPREKIHVVTNGVNEFFFANPLQSELEEVRQQFGISSRPILLFMGSLHAYKGVGVFLKALAGVSSDFTAVIAGSFKNEEEKQALVQQSGLPSEVRDRLVFTGRVTDEQLRALYRTANILVYPTLGDTLPLVVLEAMACGCPIISTNIGGIPFAVRPENGILVEPGQAEPVANAVNRLLANDPVRKSMGVASRTRAESVFRWKRSAALSADLYRSLLSQSSKGQMALSATV